MHFLPNTAAALAGAGLVSGAPILNTNAKSTNASGNASLVPAQRRRASLSTPTASKATLTNSTLEPQMYTRRSTLRSNSTVIKVKRTPSPISAEPAEAFKAAVNAKVQTFSELDKAIIARRLNAGESVNIGSIGLSCKHCLSDSYSVQKRNEPSSGQQPRKKPSVWDDPVQAGINTTGIILGVIGVFFCAGCVFTDVSRRRKAKRKEAQASSTTADIEMANQGRNEVLASEEQTSANQGRTNPESSNAQTMHTPYSGKWKRAWFGR